MFTLSIVLNVILGVCVLVLLGFAKMFAHHIFKTEQATKERESESGSIGELKQQLRDANKRVDELEDENLKLELDNSELRSQKDYFLDVINGLPIPNNYRANIRARLASVEDEK